MPAASIVGGWAFVILLFWAFVILLFCYFVRPCYGPLFLSRALEKGIITWAQAFATKPSLANNLLEFKGAHNVLISCEIERSNFLKKLAGIRIIASMFSIDRRISHSC